MNPVNSTLESEKALQNLHDTYCRLTGRDDRFGHNLRHWWEWNRHFTKQELEQVLLFVLKQNSQRQPRYRINIALAEILEPGRFDQLRAESEVERKRLAAQARKVQPSQGQVEVARMRHEDVPEPTQPEKKVSMDLIIEGMRKAAS